MYSKLKEDAESLSAILEVTQNKAIEFLTTPHKAAAQPGSYSMEGLSEAGEGAVLAMDSFLRRYGPDLSGSALGRYFGFVTGGSTPAALAGDWLTSAYDQNAQLNGDTCAPYVEREALHFLRQLFGLDSKFYGAFVSGATMANFVGLSIARQHLGRRAGVDVATLGDRGLPESIKLLSGSPHSSIYKCLVMMGIGRQHCVVVKTEPGSERVDCAALEELLEQHSNYPVIVSASAGTVNLGDFDDFEKIGMLKQKYGFWFHVDGAFGLFAGASPRFEKKLKGIEHADSITVDGHKWLNVPYDSGVIFSCHLNDQMAVFMNFAPYLGEPALIDNHYLHMVPENSRRFRALPAWMSLQAYGKAGYRDIVERNCELARRLGDSLQRSDCFALVAEVRFNVVCFRLVDPHNTLDNIKALLLDVQRAGETYLTPTTVLSQPAIRAALTNWQTTENDVDRASRSLVDAARNCFFS